MSEPQAPKSPPPIKASNLLDSILSDSGPMPPARLGIRALALLLDLILIISVSALILKASLLVNFPDAPAVWADYLESSQDFEYAKRMLLNAETANPDLLEIFAFVWSTIITVAWCYFAAGEAFFNGSSIGKRCCRLRSISTITLGELSVFTGIVRGGIKTILIFSFGIIGWTAMLLPLFFNKRRQLGHDLLSRTAVIDEKYLKGTDLVS